MEGAKNIKNFRPISLVWCIYKLIYKVQRFSKLLGEVIGERQHAFVERRQILNAVMVANEVIDDLVGNKRDGFLCEVDMEKTYDHVNWEFVDYMLGRLRFGNKWRRWMKSCITSPSFVVMINDETSSLFKGTKGL